MDLVVDKRFWELFAVALYEPDQLPNFVRQRPVLAELLIAERGRQKQRALLNDDADEGASFRTISSEVSGRHMDINRGEDDMSDEGGRAKQDERASVSEVDLDEDYEGDGPENFSTIIQQALFGSDNKPDSNFPKTARTRTTTETGVSSGGPGTSASNSSTNTSTTSALPSSKLSKKFWKRFFAKVHKHPSRRYAFGIDQWEAKVARVCADYDGFPGTQFKPSTEVKSDPINNLDGLGLGDSYLAQMERGIDYHLDFYAAEWWVFEDLRLVDCVGEGNRAKIRGRWFNVPARPKSCVEKLYGADWWVVRKGLNGVN